MIFVGERLIGEDDYRKDLIKKFKSQKNKIAFWETLAIDYNLPLSPKYYYMMVEMHSILAVNKYENLNENEIVEYTAALKRDFRPLINNIASIFTKILYLDSFRLKKLNPRLTSVVNNYISEFFLDILDIQEEKKISISDLRDCIIYNIQERKNIWKLGSIICLDPLSPVPRSFNNQGNI